jgi:putative flippase GtrA
MTNYDVPVKTTLKRDWRDLARKLIAFASASLTSSVVIAIGAWLGWDINPVLAAFIVSVVGIIAGYYVSDTVTLTPATPKIEGTPDHSAGD